MKRLEKQTEVKLFAQTAIANDKKKIITNAFKKHNIKKEESPKNTNKNIKYFKIDIRQLEKEDKTIEISNSPQALLNLEKMQLDQLWTLQNRQRNKWTDLKLKENSKLKVNKSPIVNDSNRSMNEKIENFKSNIISRIRY